MSQLTAHLRKAVRFDRNELSGAFGDLGTDFPLVVGLILTARLDSASALVMFGVMQIATGLIYGLPMPVQPLKAMAVIVITQRLDARLLFGGGLAIGITMLLLATTGLLNRLAEVVPKCVVRGIQFGLGLQLASLALKDYIAADGVLGYVPAVLGFLIVLFLLGNRRFPPATLLILLGVVWGFVFDFKGGSLLHSIGFTLPRTHVPAWNDIAQGFLLLALPQIPLSLGNSVLATRQVLGDFFPERPTSIRKIGLTYSLMNLINPFFGGIPTCHGAGGLAGHYTFGARTGGSVVIEGALYLTLGLFLSGGFETAILLFPKPVLGVILLFEALALLRLTGDTAGEPADFSIALLVGLLAFGLPYGYLIGLVVGTAVAHLSRRGLTGLVER